MPPGGEEVGVDFRCTHAGHIIICGEVVDRLVEVRHRSEGVALRFEVDEIRIAGTKNLGGQIETRVRGKQQDQSFRIAVWQGTQKHGIHQAEDRGTRSDSESERQHGHQRKGKILAQRAQSVAEILFQIVEPGDSSRGVTLFGSLGNTAERGPGRSSRLGGGHSAGDVLLCFAFQVEL